jgi:hypothetical protein
MKTEDITKTARHEVLEEITRINAVLSPLGYAITGFKYDPNKYASYSIYSFTIHLSPSSKI